MGAMATRQQSKRGAQPESTGKRCAIYVRVSTGKQEEEGTSLASQEQACREYAAQHGYTVDEARVYREVHTGTELWERPQLTALRAAMRTKALDVVVVYAIDRLSRDPVHLGVILSEADHVSVEVEFVSEPLDNSPEGQLIRFVRGYAAQVEHTKIRERTLRGKRARGQSGRPIFGHYPIYGYAVSADRTHYEINPETAPVVRNLFAWMLNGGTLRGIAARLNAEGIRMPGGGTTWRFTTVRHILANRAYTGTLEAFRFQTYKNKERGTYIVRQRPEQDRIQLSIPPLIDTATYDAVQDKLSRNRQQSTRNNRTPEAALLRGGYVRCGYCEHAMYAQRAGRGSEVLYYLCSQRSQLDSSCYHGIRVAELDGIVWGRLEAILTQPALIAAELERMRSDDPTTADLAAVERSLTAITREQRNYVEHLGKVTGASADLIAQKINALETQRTRLTAERESILARSRSWEQAQQRLADIQAWCRTVATNLSTISYAGQRLALDALGVQAKVWRKDHEPRYEVRAAIPLDVPTDPIVSTTSICGGTPSARGSRRSAPTRSRPLGPHAGAPLAIPCVPRWQTARTSTTLHRARCRVRRPPGPAT
jgi:site-specific DNA recombinase